MADQKTRDEHMVNESNEGPTNKSRTGDPGRTPGKAEGNRESVAQDLRRKERERQLKGE
ncbi:MAG TPA: hypothetical protein VNN73_08570 [Blastocatellia bacterium]|jgi:hypothetical protein|nr:hypothetical protein [Blastocatellia bacterium]